MNSNNKHLYEKKKKKCFPITMTHKLCKSRLCMIYAVFMPYKLKGCTEGGVIVIVYIYIYFYIWFVNVCVCMLRNPNSRLHNSTYIININLWVIVLWREKYPLTSHQAFPQFICYTSIKPHNFTTKNPNTTLLSHRSHSKQS